MGQPGAGAGSARIDQPVRQFGMPPRRTNGEPSMSSDVNASEIMQNKISNDDDREWYDELFKKMARDFLKPRSTVGNSDNLGRTGVRVKNLNAGLECSLRSCLIETEIISEPDDTEKKRKKKKQKNEH